MRKPVAGTAIAAIVLSFVQLFGTVNAAAASQTINLGWSGTAPARSMLSIGGGHGGFFTAGATLNAGLDWQAADQVGLAFTDGNLRQGSQLDLADSTTPGAGTVSVHYQATGNLSADSFDKSVTDAIPCAMPLSGDPANTCTDNASIALDSITVASSGFASLKVALSLNLATTITATGSPRETTRIASVAGGLAIPDAPLSLTGPTPGHLADPMSLTSIACTQPAGSHLVYSLTSNHTTGSLVMVTTVDLVAAIVASPLIGPDFTLFSGTISPSSVSSPSVLFSLAMNAADSSADLGAILPNVTPPTVNAGGPYSGVEGAPVLFDGSASSDKCGPPDLAWTFGDGSSAAGPRPTRTFAEEGVYGATLTATNVNGLSSSTSFNVPVSDAALTGLGRTIITAQAFSGTVASFTDADPAGVVADYTATISWGDGTTTAGTVSAVAGGFSVNGAHTFAAAALGPQTFSTTVCDAGGSCVTTTSQALVFSYTTGGSFTVGDTTAGVLNPGAIGAGNAVTFWGAQWTHVNSLSGGSAPASFKGFSNDPSIPVCGMPWSTRPGNSAPPAASVPTYTAMVVSDAISKSGAQITGDTPHIVIVKTSPGYAPDPGHPGQGVIVGVLC